MSRCIVVVSEEAGKTLSSNGSQNRDPTNSGTPQHISTNGESSSSDDVTAYQRASKPDGFDSKNGGEPSKSFSNIDQGEPRKCPSCHEHHYGSSQLKIFCPECEHDKIQTGELQLPENPQYSEQRETW